MNPMNRSSRKETLMHTWIRPMAWGCALLAMASGCATTKTYEPRQSQTPPANHRRLIKPVVAVTEFENRASFSGQWNLGQGFADVLGTELLDTKRVVVLERRNLGDVVGEIARQGTELFRSEGRVNRGQLRNARYLLRGVITDFTVTGDASGWFAGRTVRGWLGGTAARVAINIKASDVETGEIVGSVRASGTARSNFFQASVSYKDLNFGGDAFFRTPLGSATEKAIRRAVKELLRTLPDEYWQPHVAEVTDDGLIINGGSNVDLAVGDEFLARETGKPVRDPITGDVIETLPGSVTGHVRVTEVRSNSSRALLLSGTARKGMRLEPAPKPH